MTAAGSCNGLLDSRVRRGSGVARPARQARPPARPWSVAITRRVRDAQRAIGREDPSSPAAALAPGCE
jgi:hypothetical protein